MFCLSKSISTVNIFILNHHNQHGFKENFIYFKCKRVFGLCLQNIKRASSYDSRQFKLEAKIVSKNQNYEQLVIGIFNLKNHMRTIC